MQSKSLLIAIAALAVTATGVHAHAGGALLNRANLSEQQRAALQEAAQLRADGEITAARDVLIEAGIDEAVLQSIRHAATVSRHAIHDAVVAGDYYAFGQAIVGTPLADVVTSEADFLLFKEAHDLRVAGSHVAAKSIYDELGIEHRARGFGYFHRHTHAFDVLSDEEKDALRAARQANDRETVRAILRDAGADNQ